MATPVKKGLPNKDQLMVMLKRYSSLQLVPLDNHQEPMTITSESSEFKKPIFFDTDCGKTMNKIKMALKQQAFYPHDNGAYPSRIRLEGSLDLVEKTCDYHYKLQGDDPYNVKQPFENKVYLMHGFNIPEYTLFEDDYEYDNEE